MDLLPQHRLTLPTIGGTVDCDKFCVGELSARYSPQTGRWTGTVTFWFYREDADGTKTFGLGPNGQRFAVSYSTQDMFGDAVGGLVMSRRIDGSPVRDGLGFPGLGMWFGASEGMFADLFVRFKLNQARVAKLREIEPLAAQAEADAKAAEAVKAQADGILASATNAADLQAGAGGIAACATAARADADSAATAVAAVRAATSEEQLAVDVATPAADAAGQAAQARTLLEAMAAAAVYPEPAPEPQE